MYRGFYSDFFSNGVLKHSLESRELTEYVWDFWERFCLCRPRETRCICTYFEALEVKNLRLSDVKPRSMGLGRKRGFFENAEKLGLEALKEYNWLFITHSAAGRFFGGGWPERGKEGCGEVEISVAAGAFELRQRRQMFMQHQSAPPFLMLLQ